MSLRTLRAIAGTTQYFNGFMPAGGQDTDIYESQSIICGFEWFATQMYKSELYPGQVAFIDGAGNWYIGNSGYGIISVAAGDRNDKPLCRNSHWQGYNALCEGYYDEAPPGQQCI